MNKTTILLTNILACVLLAAPAAAQFTPQATAIPGSVPEGINYQGRLEDGGFPVNATKSMVFRVYSALTGGILLWTSPAQSVSVSMGLFNAVVPVPVTTLVGGGARYLEVQVAGTLMSPRELLNSVPYALIAKSVEGTIDVSTAGLAINANSAATQPAFYISSQTGNVGVGTGSPATSFDVGGSAQFGSGTTKSTFTASGALNMAAKVTAPDYTATYGINASTAVFTYVQASSITTTGNVNVQGSVGIGTANPSGLFSVGAGSFVVTSAGAVGIGTSAPAESLELLSPGSAASLGLASSAASTNAGTEVLKMGTYIGGVYTPTAIIGDTSGADSNLKIFALQGNMHLGSNLLGSASTRMVINTAGGVTIGSSDLASTLNLLHIDGLSDFVVNTAGNVGIGTTNPGYPLVVQTNSAGTTPTSNIVARFQANASGRDASIQFSDNVTYANFISMTGGDFLFTTSNPGAVNAMIIKGSGNVGVGSASPATKLHMSSGTMTIDGNAATSLTTTGRIGVGTSVADTALHVVGAAGGTALTLTDNVNATMRFSFPSAGVAAIASNEAAHSLAFGGQSSAGGAFTERFRINNVTGNSTFPSGNIGIGTGVAIPNDRLEVASGNIRLTAIAGSAGSVKLFSTLTAAATSCTTQCGVNTACLAAWDSAGAVSTCGTSALANRCLCSGFGD